MAKAKNTYKSTQKKERKDKTRRKPLKALKDRRLQLSIGFILIALSLFLFTSFISHLFTGKDDQSVVEAFGEVPVSETGLEVQNWCGLFGALAADLFIFDWFGIASFLIPPFLFLLGYFTLFKKQIISIKRTFYFSLFFLFWTSILMGYLTFEVRDANTLDFIAGGLGYEMASLSHSLFGWGTFVVLMVALLVFTVFFFNITSLFGWSTKDFQNLLKDQEKETSKSDEELIEEESWLLNTKPEKQDADAKNEPSFDLEIVDNKEIAVDDLVDEGGNDACHQELNQENEEADEDDGPAFTIGKTQEEKKTSEIEYYDPTLDLSSYRFPTIDLLKEYEHGQVKVTKEELEQNKNKIVDTLTNFKIGISSIKATIGPTVTLYEIIPDAGVKISRIKNLEDDIALSLAALGIRIIAPIPGKGTIGIEVPNKNREMVSMKSVISTEKFSKSTYELPVVLGKTISNEVYVTDLSKMPHLLMAGATGQGKSVGLNVLLTSLIYKKHPSQLKFVLVDPKKVELTLFNKIERHFLAKLPDNEEAIITDTKTVINTLNSLCIEMDDRLSLLKDAGCRNLKEYNQKFVQRRLNPEKGHRYLPYVVLVIDELADLMVTAGKEVETPIARLAAVARAIGIHLVLATQRPSVNVITGVIKANFPARMSFRVTSKIDSRTILDMGGADQLVGMGDMLFSLGSELVRLQCPFVDTSEVEEVCEFVGGQRGYESAYLLPEFSGDDESGSPGAIDLADRDTMFEDAARLIVQHQQGSTSLIQRKLKLGYNRAGRLIDQLEAAGIVGPFEGSKAREVLIPDEYSLEQKLNEIHQNN